jgi:hypothetical protein
MEQGGRELRGREKEKKKKKEKRWWIWGYLTLLPAVPSQ